MELIDRTELIETIWRADVSSREKIAEIINSQPTIKEWGISKDFYKKQYVCPNCNSEFSSPSKYCPNCGTRLTM